MRNGLRVVLLLLVAAMAGVWWLGRSVPIPTVSTFWLAEADAIETLRRVAGQDGPQDIRVGIVGRTELPGWFNTAWGGFAGERRVFICLQLLYSDGHVIIDVPFGPDTHREILGDDAPFDMDQFERMNRALGSAHRIFISHVHRDHLGGLADSPYARELLSRTEVTAEQKAGLRLSTEIEPGDIRTLGFALDDFDDLARVHKFDRMKALAPGVVAIRTPGHTPGHLMFFIRMADGQELLYVGDLMWSYRNIEFVRSRPYGVANYFLGEDAVAVADQLRAVMTFADANPDVEIVVSHDAERIENQVARGVLHLGLR